MTGSGAGCCLKPFRSWTQDLSRLPSPVLLHPVAFTAGGHDASDPDFLPPDPRWGSDADFRSMIDGGMQAAMQLFFTGKLKVTGDANLATKLSKLLQMAS